MATKTQNEFFGNAKWIGIDRQKEAALGGTPATYLKREFKLTKKQSGRLYIAGLGLFSAYLNGKKIGKSVLNSPFTNYNERVLFESFDLSGLLKKGVNTLTVSLGDGWYNQNSVDTWRFYKASFRGDKKLILRLVTDEVEIISDESFRVSEDGPVWRSALRLGEYYNANLTPSYSEYAVIKDAPLGKLTKNTMHPIEETAVYKYISIEKKKDGYLLDFGHNIAGYARLKLFGKAGKKIRLIYGDRLEDGDIDNDSNAQFILDTEQAKDYQCDIVILKDGLTEYKPEFVYHGFRYIKVIGLDAMPSKEDVVAIRVGTSFKRISEFSSSSVTLNRLNNMAIESQLANFVGIPTDCPHREKNGWTGDLQLSIEQMLFNFDATIDLYKFLDDICDCQLKSGQIPCIVPTVEGLFGYEWGTGPAWDVAMFLIPYEITKRTGEHEPIRKYIPYLKRYLEYLEGKKQDSGLIGYGLGDWNAPKECEVTPAPVLLTDSLYYALMNDCMAHLLKKLNEDGKEYSRRAKEMRERVRACFVKENGEVADGGATAEASVIYFGVVEGCEKDRVFNCLLETLKRDKYTMRFGILGSKFVFRALCECGRVDIALKMLKQSKYPSFANWIKRGAVTLWEDFEGTNSRNHYMFSDFSSLLAKYVAGIDYEIIDGTQYNTVRINRLYGENTVRASTVTPNGRLAIKQKRKNGEIKVTLDLPENSESRILFEDGTQEKITSGEYTFKLK